MRQRFLLFTFLAKLKKNQGCFFKMPLMPSNGRMKEIQTQAETGGAIHAAWCVPGQVYSLLAKQTRTLNAVSLPSAHSNL